MGLHSDLEALGAALLVRRTKVLYAAVALLLFGTLGMIVQATESSSAVGVVAPALSDACKDYKFYVGHVEACGAAAQITSDPTAPPSPSPTSDTSIIADVAPITTTVDR
jgi:hypothetical protein